MKFALVLVSCLALASCGGRAAELDADPLPRTWLLGIGSSEGGAPLRLRVDPQNDDVLLTFLGVESLAGLNELPPNGLLRLDRFGRLKWSVKQETGFYDNLAVRGAAVLASGTVFRHASDGRLEWAIESASPPVFVDVVLDAASNAYLLAVASEASDLGGTQLEVCEVAGKSTATTLVIKLDALGEVRWIRTFPDERGAALAVTPSGEVRLLSGDEPLCECGTKTYEQCKRERMFLSAWDPEGNLLWRRYANDWFFRPVGLALDEDGSVVAAANVSRFENGLVFDETFAQRIDPTGTVLWTRKVAGPGTYFADLAVRGGRIYVAGSATGTLDLGGGPIGGEWSPFVVVLDAAGEHLWTIVGTGERYKSATALDVMSTGEIALAGLFEGTFELGALPPVTSSGGKDIFVAVVDPGLD